MLRFFIPPDKARAIEQDGLRWLSRTYSREIYANVITEFPDFPAMEYGRGFYSYEPPAPALVQLICKKEHFRREAPLVGIIYRRLKAVSGAIIYQWVFFFNVNDYEECKEQWQK